MSFKQSIPQIVTLLKQASDAYYNGGEQTMDDDTYDSLLEILRERDPKNSYLTTIGSPPQENAIVLPYKMASLDKIKPGMPSLTRFLGCAPSYVASDKLDGLSALWCPGKKSLYLRGDGRVGQKVNHLVGMTGLVPSIIDFVVRGEIVLRRDAVEPGQIPRTIVNGLVHRNEISASDLTRLRFVAYEVVQPGMMSRSKQFEWLKQHGFELPWFTVLTKPTEPDLIHLFQQRRGECAYDIDGIVIGIDQIPHIVGEAIGPVTGPVKNPKDCVAFKMPLSDQSATTTVQEVMWTPSAQGYLIPRIRFTPIIIGGATIEFCTGHNARTIVAGSIGPGAQIQIRRSGDVIPTLEHIVTPASEPAMPPTTIKWEWVGSPADAIHIRTTETTNEQTISQLIHFAKVLDIANLGPANCKALVDEGLGSPKAIWSATPDRLAAILGPKTGATLYTDLRKAFERPTVTEVTLLLASSKLPRGVGESKLTALLAAHPDPRTWATCTRHPPPTGWTEKTFQEFQKVYATYEPWRIQEFHWIPYPRLANVLPVPVTATSNPIKTVCFTGFRDATLEEWAKSAGFQPVASVTNKLSVLVTADGAKSSEKSKKADALGTVEVLQRSEFMKKYLE